MNIFFLDEDPKKAAMFHCDKHVPKMILETAQMLCTVLRDYSRGVDLADGYSDFVFDCDRYEDIRLYKPTHRNHPCTKWIHESRENYRWLIKMVEQLNEEFKIRFGHSENHKSYDVILGLPDLSVALPDVPMTRPAEAMPDEFKSSSPVESYRNYYLRSKANMLSWKTKKPEWAA